MEFFLTDKDTDIEKNIQKDPLCQESIWRYYAGKLYENINSVTNDIKGFIITSLWNHICTNIRSKYNNKGLENLWEKTEKSSKYYVAYEMIIIYILIENNANVSFIGKENGKKIYNKYKENPIISIAEDAEADQKSILVRQEQLGYIGRYRSKVNNINDDEILNLAFDSESLEKITNEFYRIFTVLYKDKRKREIKYKDKKNREIEYKNCFKNKDLKDRLINGLKIKDSNKEKYLEILKIKDGKENGLNKIYKYICDNEKLDAKDIITSLSGLSDKDVDVDIKNKLKNILVVENFLVEINNLFYEILNCKKINNLINACDSNDSDDKEVNNSIEDIKKMTEKLKSIYEELKSNFKNKNEKNLICSSYKKTCEELDNIKFEKGENTEITVCNIKKIIYSIIEDHVNLQNKSHKKSWIEKDSNGNIKIKHKVEHKYNDRWEHDYYISTIKNIVGSMKEWN